MYLARVLGHWGGCAAVAAAAGVAGMGVVGTCAWGQVAPARLLGDLNQEFTYQSSSNPGQFRAVGSRVVFTALGEGSTYDLYGSEGSGAELLLRVYGGSAAAGPDYWSFTGTDGVQRLVIARSPTDVQSPARRRELWITDGTSAGTVLLKAAEPQEVSEGFEQQVYGFRDVGSGLGVFIAWTSATGFELWRTDGTAAGTGMVKDLAPGTASSTVGTQFVRVGPSLFFAGAAGSGDQELWKTDGAIGSAATGLVRDLRVGPESSGPFLLGALGSQVILAAYDSDFSADMWRSDGTSAGTQRLKDFSGAFRGFTNLSHRVVNQRMVFFATDDVAGTELWSTDGTAGGTQMLGDIAPGANSNLITPILLEQAGGPDPSFMCFTAVDPVRGREIWRTDGTPAGTMILGDLSTSPASAGTAVGTGRVLPDGRVLLPVFRGGSPVPAPALYLTNVQGTSVTLVAELPGGRDVLLGAQPMLNSAYPFCVDVGTANTPMTEVWTTDLTSNGTRRVFAIPFTSSLSWAGTGLRVLGGGARAVFPAAPYRQFGSSSAPVTLYTSDGTTAGTRELVPDAFGAPLTMYSDRFGWESLGGQVYFAAGDTRGIEPWVTDGTGAGTHQVVNIRPDSSESSNPAHLLSAGGKVVFLASQTGRTDLYRTDGSGGGTERVAAGLDPYRTPAAISGGRVAFEHENTVKILDAASGVVSRLFAADDPAAPEYPGGVFGPVLGGRFLFTGYRPQSVGSLYISDGTSAGTSVIPGVVNVGDGPAIADLTRVGSGAGERVYFTFGSYPMRSIWSTDGQSMVQHTNMAGGFATRRPYELLAMGDRLAFRDDVPGMGDEMVVLDGVTNSATVLEVWAGPDGSSPAPMGVFDGYLVFDASASLSDRATYVSDGTGAGTFAIDADPGPARPTAEPLTTWEGRIIVRSYVTELGDEIFAVDPVNGTAVLLGEIEPGDPAQGTTSFRPIGRTAMGVLGYAADVEHGIELWITDATAAGTRRVADINPGPQSGWPQFLCEEGGRVYFVADGGSAGGGRGVYSTDGLVVERMADCAAFDVTASARAGRTVVFSAQTGATGWEPWAWDLPRCVADFDGSGAVSVQDLFDFLGAYFAGAAAADVDGSGAVNVGDIFAYIDSFFGGCV